MFALENVRLTARQAATNIGVIHAPGHAEPWIIAMSATPGYLTTLDYSARWAIEPRFSDFTSRGFGGADTQIQHPDRLARLLLVMALAPAMAAWGRRQASPPPLSTSSSSRSRCSCSIRRMWASASSAPCRM